MENTDRYHNETITKLIRKLESIYAIVGCRITMEYVESMIEPVIDELEDLKSAFPNKHYERGKQ